MEIRENRTMNERYTRTERIIGEEKVNLLHEKKVAIFGIGGVGGHCVEALARAGVGTLALIDGDTFDVSNLNRQLFATEKTIGMKKVDGAEARINEVNSQVKVEKYNMFYSPDITKDEIDLEQFDYVVDAIDDVKAKVHLIKTCTELEIPIIASMGTGNKMDPSMFQVEVLSKTSVCPLAKIMRKELKKFGITKTKVVYSKEEPAERVVPPGSISFVPPVAGLIMAGQVIRDLIGWEK